jgi:hypothetical protein
MPCSGLSTDEQRMLPAYFEDSLNLPAELLNAPHRLRDIVYPEERRRLPGRIIAKSLRASLPRAGWIR